jgi:hypothetical protein
MRSSLQILYGFILASGFLVYSVHSVHGQTLGKLEQNVFYSKDLGEGRVLVLTQGPLLSTAGIKRAIADSPSRKYAEYLGVMNVTAELRVKDETPLQLWAGTFLCTLKAEIKAPFRVLDVAVLENRYWVAVDTGGEIDIYEFGIGIHARVTELFKGDWIMVAVEKPGTDWPQGKFQYDEKKKQFSLEITDVWRETKQRSVFECKANAFEFIRAAQSKEKMPTTASGN